MRTFPAVDMMATTCARCSAAVVEICDVSSQVLQSVRPVLMGDYIPL